MPEIQPLPCLEVEGADLTRPVLPVPAPGEDHHLPADVRRVVAPGHGLAPRVDLCHRVGLGVPADEGGQRLAALLEGREAAVNVNSALIRDTGRVTPGQQGIRGDFLPHDLHCSFILCPLTFSYFGF